MNRLTNILIATAMTLGGATAVADVVCKQVDKKGNITFTNAPKASNCMERIVLDSDHPKYHRAYDRMKADVDRFNRRLDESNSLEADRQVIRDINLPPYNRSY